MNQSTSNFRCQAISLSAPIGQLVREFPQTSRVFDGLGLDYCCDGKRSLDEACQRKKYDPQDVVAQLQAVVSVDTRRADEQFPYLSMTEMCDAIESTHHRYLKSELPRLTTLLETVRQAHGTKYTWLEDLETSFKRFVHDLVPHLFEEENVLFPAIRQLDKPSSQPFFPFGSINNPIRMMEHEHKEAGDALEQIRVVTSDFTIPDDGCSTLRALLDGLRVLDSDFHRHTHKENDILFPFVSEKAVSHQREWRR